MSRPVSFLFLGETLLMPHLFPIVEALAASSDVPIDLWVSTSVHEGLLKSWLPAASRVRIRRAPAFRKLKDTDGCNLPLPPKLVVLAGLAPRLLKSSAVVCAEQTSLLIPTLLPFPVPFVKTSHGVGSMSARDDRRRRAPALTLVPSERERQTYLDRGHAPSRIVSTGYVKAGFRQRTHRRLPFAEARPVVLYTPHWQPHRSSWHRWGRQVVEQLAGQADFNIVLAPHQRLVETAPELRRVLAEVAHLPHVHCDLDSFATVDGSYTEACDIYLGDTSSQVVEFLVRPRPCVFLNPGRADWKGDPAFAQWHCGEVVEQLDEVGAALRRASSLHEQFEERQREFAASSLGDTSGAAPARAAELILEVSGGAELV
ncbi:MAG TPA: hypothetical protein VF582_07835 [Allosphingosinicella sp.]|jgi:hypothetical protein